MHPGLFYIKIPCGEGINYCLTGTIPRGELYFHCNYIQDDDSQRGMSSLTQITVL